MPLALPRLVALAALAVAHHRQLPLGDLQAVFEQALIDGPEVANVEVAVVDGVLGLDARVLPRAGEQVDGARQITVAGAAAPKERPALRREQAAVVGAHAQLGLALVHHLEQVCKLAPQLGAAAAQRLA